VNCTVTNAASCVAPGRFDPGSLTCGTVGNPTTCCPANINGTDGVSVQDIFDFIGLWFANAPRGDFNGAGGITLQDIFDFLTAYFTGCP
jgi:hypothetical protein